MPELLAEFLEHMKQKNRVVNYVQVRQNDQIIEDYKRLDSKTRLNTWSVSKSFISIGVGIAIDEGLLTLEEKICDSFPEYLPEHASENLLSLTVRDLLTMTTGLENALFFADDAERYHTEDWISYFFQSSFSRKPGERFLYSNFNTYMLSCLIEKKSKENLLEYLRYRLFEPLEIHSPDWTFCPKGHVHAANGLYVTIDELGNFGEMLLHKGEYKGKRIVSSAYVEAAGKDQLGLPEPEDGYGYQFWINPDHKSFRADGKFGQFVLVLPEKNAVISVQSLDSKAIFPYVWKDIATKL